MKLQEILEKVNNFNTNEETEEFEITEFFDRIGADFAGLESLTNKEKEITVQTFFNFIKRQSPELNEDWSFIHLIESVDKPEYEIYKSQLIQANKENPSFTSLILLIRFINSLEGKEWEEGMKIIKDLSEKDGISELIKEEAKEYYEDESEEG